MINNIELCPKCGGIAVINAYFNKHRCANKECDFHQLIVRKNEDWIEPLENSQILNRKDSTINKIIKVLNKITNPDVNDKNIVL